MITNNSVVKIQNLVVNHESRPVKSNSAITTKTGTEVEHYHTCVNLLVKFCHDLLLLPEAEICRKWSILVYGSPIYCAVLALSHIFTVKDIKNRGKDQK